MTIVEQAFIAGWKSAVSYILDNDGGSVEVAKEYMRNEIDNFLNNLHGEINNGLVKADRRS